MGAIEAVAAYTVFTTHTPVTAGHDYFSERPNMALGGIIAYPKLAKAA